jgi:hypothetical protein
MVAKGASGARSYLSVCAIYRDEASYLAEWIEFHRLVGVERFFLYDNFSRDDHREVLLPYVEQGTVVLTDWHVREEDVVAPSTPRWEAHAVVQAQCYDDCIRRHGEESRWIAFIDTDEFLFSPTGHPLPEILAEYEAWPGVAVNWMVFGTSDHESRPSGLVIESYVRRSPETATGNRIVKSIVDPSRVAGCQSVHHFVYLDGHAVNERREPVEGGHSDYHSSSRLRVNHYWTKSEDEFAQKLERWTAAGASEYKDPASIKRLKSSRNEVPDHTIASYVPALRERLSGARS